MSLRQLSFAQVCDALRRNDESILELSTRSFPRGYGAPLGEALVQSLETDGTTIMNHRLQDVTLLLRPLLNEEDTTIERSATLLLHFLQNSPNLRCVHLVSDSFDGDGAPTGIELNLARQMLLAVSQNSSIVVLELSFYEDFCCPMPEFLAIFRMPSLQELSLEKANFPDSANSTVTQEALHDAIVANTSIKSVDLSLSSSSTIPTQLLLALARHVRLEKLQVTREGEWIEVTNEHIQALVCLLRTTRTLQVLTLSFPIESKEFMEYLVEGLQANQTLQTLSFGPFYDISELAQPPFIKYMQSSPHGHSLQRLEMVDGCGNFLRAENGPFIVDLITDAETAETNMMNDPGQISSLPLTTAVASVASTLKVLELTGITDRLEFFQALLPVADRVRLQGLAFRHFRRPTCPLLCECLPRLVHVHMLECGYDMQYQGDASNFVRAMKTNGSLHEVAINFGRVEQCPLTHRYQRLVQAYCQRNKALQDNFLASSLANERHASDSGGGDELDDSLDSPLSLSVLSTAPSALDTALQAPRLAPNNMLKALVGLGERLNGCGSKRKRQVVPCSASDFSTTSFVETETVPKSPKRLRTTKGESPFAA